MHSLTHNHRKPGKASASETRGLVLNWWGWIYDLIARFGMRFILGGSEQALRQTTTDLAQLQPGETVLDVGGGTGTLALVAKGRVGAAGRGSGIDPPAAWLPRPGRKGARRRLGTHLPLWCA